MTTAKANRTAPFFDKMGLVDTAEDDVAAEDGPLCNLSPLRIPQMLRVNTNNPPYLALLDFSSKLSASLARLCHSLLAVGESGHT